MRDLKKTDKNILKIIDSISGSEIEVYYRTPTVEDVIEYQRLLVKRHGGKTILDAVTAQLTMGLKILTGFREGDFGIDGKPISSDPQSPNYHSTWKELLRDAAPDIVRAVAYTVFEGARVQSGDEVVIGSEVDDQLPLAKNSGD